MVLAILELTIEKNKMFTQTRVHAREHTHTHKARKEKKNQLSIARVKKSEIPYCYLEYSLGAQGAQTGWVGKVSECPVEEVGQLRLEGERFVPNNTT